MTLQIVIPAAGLGQRFADAGYTKPKPFIDVAGKPMLQRVIDCLTPSDGEAKFLIVERRDTDCLYGSPDVMHYCVSEPTQGAVDTVLQAERGIKPQWPVLIANCDQFLDDGVIDEFLQAVWHREAGILTFNSTNPHHSYARITNGRVTEVVEKQVISDNALVGVYYFADSTVLFDYARKVIANNLRHGSGEFYISAILSLFVADGHELVAHEVDVHRKHMLGTPDELQIFLDKVADGRVTL